MRETRTATLDAADVRDDTSTEEPAFRFTGHAAVFDQRTWIGHPKLGFWETIQRGFFDDVLGDQAAFLVNHDPNHILARNGNTMTLAVDERGLVPEADWDPDDPEARFRRGQAHLALNHPALAVADLQIASQNLPNRPDVFYNLALALHADHKAGPALNAAQHALTLAPNDPETRTLTERLRR